MSNFFARQPVPVQPMPEPPGFDFMRYLLMQRFANQMMNPYGLSPQGMGNFGGFNQGSRPFNPYGGGQQMGGFGGGGGGPMTPPQGMPPGGPMPSGSPVSGAPGPGINPLIAAIINAGRGQQQGGPQPTPMQGQRPMPVGPRQGGGYDGDVVGYGGNVMGASPSYQQPGFPMHQPQNVLSLMRMLHATRMPQQAIQQPHMGRMPHMGGFGRR